MKLRSLLSCLPQSITLAGSSIVSSVMLLAGSGGDDGFSQSVIGVRTKAVLTVDGRSFRDANGNMMMFGLGGAFMPSPRKKLGCGGWL
jgi:hypothetical protein